MSDSDYRGVPTTDARIAADKPESRADQFRRYADPDNPERYVQYAQEVLGLRLAATQKRILRAVATDPYVLIESGNGVGKTFALAIANLAHGTARHSSTEAIELATSGTYDLLGDTLWSPMKALHARRSLPGRAKDNPPRIEDYSDTDPSFFKAIAPRYPDNLEGRHADTILVTVEEADKPDITAEHIDSAESNVTSASDRMAVVCNPPRDETNIVAVLAEKDKYTYIRFSSFESHNALNDYAEDDPGYIPGLVTRSKIREDWIDWNNEEWPGFERARDLSDPDHPDFRTDLDERWYRRRAGCRPPDGATAHRPFHVVDAEQALNKNERPAELGPLLGIGIDVARKGGDKIVYRRLYEHYTESVEWANERLPDTKSRIRDILDAEPALAPIAVDAVGIGADLADQLEDAYPNVYHFKSGKKPETDEGQDRFYDMWTEALDALGGRLSDLAIDQRGDTKIREELFVAARTIKFHENQRRSGDVLKASSKDDIKERLGHSPDSFDALAMAAWAADDLGEDHEKSSPVPW